MRVLHYGSKDSLLNKGLVFDSIRLCTLKWLIKFVLPPPLPSFSLSFSLLSSLTSPFSPPLPSSSLLSPFLSPLSLSPPPLISFLPSPFICVSSHNPISPDCFHLIHLSSSGRHYIRGSEGRGRHQILRRKLYGVSMWYGATSLYDEDRLISLRTRAVKIDRNKMNRIGSEVGIGSKPELVWIEVFVLMLTAIRSTAEEGKKEKDRIVLFVSIRSFVSSIPTVC
uniref:Uncharacterized protein n=2 Tax=Cacopsylla melanoneura TaxID=428564 RepID=A0A8D8Y9H0_9HEMI